MKKWYQVVGDCDAPRRIQLLDYPSRPVYRQRLKVPEGQQLQALLKIISPLSIQVSCRHHHEDGIFCWIFSEGIDFSDVGMVDPATVLCKLCPKISKILNLLKIKLLKLSSEGLERLPSSIECGDMYLVKLFEHFCEIVSPLQHTLCLMGLKDCHDAVIGVFFAHPGIDGLKGRCMMGIVAIPI